ncbi:hypothetical protein [Subtercola sp. YIM 133946]|uniref:hypothetical protein n=1 Tax=Subtercola sp. YIM 133946 TaxID=3118909 RepID=UPI002F93191D
MQPEKHTERLLAASDALRSGALERLLLDEAVSIADAITAFDTATTTIGTNLAPTNTNVVPTTTDAKPSTTPPTDPALLSYTARLRLISSCTLSGDTEGRLAALDWCLAKHLADPRRFPARIDNLDLLWELTTIPDTVAASPEFDRTVIVESLNTLRSMLQRHGEGLSALRFAQVRVARLIATPEDQATAHLNLAATPLDDYSPCRTCRLGEHALTLAEQARFDEAAAAFDLLFDDPESCAHEPELSYARSLSVYLHAGQPKKAARSHQLGYPLIRSNPRHLGLVALHIDYLRMVDALDDALALIERHLPWLPFDPLNAAAQFDALVSIAAVLDALDDADRGSTIIHQAAHPAVAQFFAAFVAHPSATDARLSGPHGADHHPTTARQFARTCSLATHALATEFDYRNRTTLYADRLDAGPTPPINLRPAVRARLAKTASAQPDGIQAAFASLPHDAPASELWLQLAREHATVEDPDAALAAIRWAHDALDAEHRAAQPTHLHVVAAPVATRNADAAGDGVADTAADAAADTARRHHVRTALYGLEITLAIERGDTVEAERLAGLRADVLIADDRLDLAEVELQVGLVLFGAETAPAAAASGFARLEQHEEHDKHEEHARASAAAPARSPAPTWSPGSLERALSAARTARVEPEAETSILNALAVQRLKEGRSAEAVELMLAAVRRCGHDPDNPTVQRPLVLLAHAQLAEGDFDAVRQTTNRLLRHTLDRATRANALLLRAAASHGLSQLNAGIADADRALSLYLELGYSKGIIDACARLALLLEELGVQAGVAEAWRHAATEADRINHPEAAVIRFRLARALITAGRGAEAAVELDAVLEATVRAKASDSELSEVLYWLGHAHREAADDELAYCCFSVALSRAAAATDGRACVRLGLALARLLLDDGDASAIDVLVETVAQARRLDEPWELVDALHLLGQAQCEFGDPGGLRAFDEALAVADQHAFDLDALHATITDSRAHALDALGRDAEALETARRAARLYERLGERSSAGLAHLFVARLLGQADRPTEAVTAYRRSVELLGTDGPTAAFVSRELRALSAPATPATPTTSPG